MKTITAAIRAYFARWKAEWDRRQAMHDRKAARWQLLEICPTLHNVETDKTTAAQILGITEADLQHLIDMGELHYDNSNRQTLGLVDILCTDVVHINRKHLLE